jgi:hypothetical protein
VRGLAARYPDDVSPLAGLKTATPKAFADLAHLVPIGTEVGLFTTTPPDVPARWTVMRNLWIDQMVWEQAEPATRTSLLELRQEDVPGYAGARRRHRARTLSTKARSGWGGTEASVPQVDG